MDAQHALGFTLIELVITLVLIGILSTLGISLLASPGGYSASAARDQFVSTALLAQKHALANSGKTMVLVVDVDEDADEWSFCVGEEDPDVDCKDMPLASIRTAAREGASLSINNSPLNNGSRTFKFGASGHLANGVPVHLKFDGTSVHNACISSLGFPYTGSCK